MPLKPRVDLRAAFDPFRRRAWTLVQAVLAGALAGALAVAVQQRRYESTASVVIAGEHPAGAELASARSPRVTALALNARAGAGISPTSFMEHSDVSARGRALEFHVSDPSPDRAAALATGYATAYASSQQPPLQVRPATSATQVEPRPARAMALSFLAGGAVGVALILLMEAFDQRIRRPVDVSAALGLPLLGSVPIPAALRGGRLAVRVDPEGDEAEIYRTIRTNVVLLTLHGGMRSIMVTSALDTEGRTTTAANLALACALGGRSVALVDLDLLHPAVGPLFGLEDRPGLADVLDDRLSLESALAAVDLYDATLLPTGDLDVLPLGHGPVNLTEDGVAAVVQELSATHDLVFLDAPPLLPTVDAWLLSRSADAMIVVANLVLLPKRLVPELGTAVDACATTPLGVVATGAEPGRADHRGGYYDDRRKRHFRRPARRWAA